MKRILFIIICATIMSCGLSLEEKKEKMSSDAEKKLTELYQEAIKINPDDIEITTKEIKEGAGIIGGGEYCGRFHCKFTDPETDDRVMLILSVEFDKKLSIAKAPEAYGKDKQAIEVSQMLINSRPVSGSLKNSKYVLESFCNL